MKRVMKLLAVVAAIISVISVLLPKPQADHVHTWQECSLEGHGENITDPELDHDPTQDTIVIAFNDLSAKEIEALGREIGLDLEPTSEIGKKFGHYQAIVPEGAVPKIKAHMVEHGYLRYISAIQEDFQVRTYGFGWSLNPSDPMFANQWNLEQIGIPDAWNLSTGRGVVVAVLDTGVSIESGKTGSTEIKPLKDLEHTGMVRGYDFIGKSEFVFDGHGHGSHVAGTIAQSTNNGYGLAGVAFHSKIMPVRVLDAHGSGSSAGVADGIVFAADNGAHVINMSLGSSMPSKIIERAVNYAREKGVVIVAAAGNDGVKAPGYPAAFPGVIAVAATQYDRNTTPYSQWGSFVDIAAPGGNTKLDQNGDGIRDGVIQETTQGGKDLNTHYFGNFNGTSMASPHVAGVAALIMQWGITNPSAVERYLYSSADISMMQDDEEGPSPETKKYDPEEFEMRYGAGIVQADLAVRSALLDTGLKRFGMTLLLAFLMLYLLARQDLLQSNIKKVGVFVASAVFAGSGLFFLPFILEVFPVMHQSALVATLISLLTLPIPKWDWVLLGVTQTPVLASCLIPVGLVVLCHGHKFLRYVAMGIAVGFSAFMLTEIVLQTSALMWIGSGLILTSLFYLVMASITFGITYLAYKE